MWSRCKVILCFMHLVIIVYHVNIDARRFFVESVV